MYALARVRLTGVVLVLLAGIGACGGGSALSAPTTSGAPAATTPTTADRVASLADVFAAPLPAGYSLADAPADQRNSVRQPLQTADGAKVVRDIDLRVIRRAGRTIGSVFVFLLQPGQELQEAAIVKGYAESRSGSSLSAASVGGKNVTLIKWSGSADLAYAASTNKIVAITDVISKPELDAVTPSLISLVQ